MVILLNVIIILFALALAAIGAWVAIQSRNNQDEAELSKKIERSGSYGVLRHSIREDLKHAKPAMAEIKAWLQQPEQNLSPEQVDNYIQQWQNSLDQVISTVEEGDSEGISTFRILIKDKDKDLCCFLHEDNFITREQIHNHPYLLPPYYPGCSCELTLKQPWDNPSKSGWKSLLPQEDGKYKVPDWRQLA
ncbi:MAG: hypothetical protein GX801_05140 [Fibrobacter sp.]|nr:hypothetical protein [Fibrobacter sp.]